MKFSGTIDKVNIQMFAMVLRMPNKSGTRLSRGEKWSTEYEGFIEREDGTFRMPFTWENKEGKTRSANRYFLLASCSVCGLPNLVEKVNFSRYPNTYCSDACRRAGKSKPDGNRKHKGGKNKDSHIMIKQHDHPAAKKGYVPEHRLVVERSIGRYLKEVERVHHINCIKSDNRPENLVLCANDQEHFLAHGSLNKCVAGLIDAGVLEFDRASMTYRIADALLIARYGLTLQVGSGSTS